MFKAIPVLFIKIWNNKKLAHIYRKAYNNLTLSSVNIKQKINLKKSHKKTIQTPLQNFIGVLALYKIITESVKLDLK